MADRFRICEQAEGWYIRDEETGDRLPYDHGLGHGVFFTYRPVVQQVAEKLNAVASASLTKQSGEVA